MKENFVGLGEFFRGAEFEWCVCGGYAIDLFTGHNSRSHQDLDIALFWQDKKKVIEFMLKSGWRVFEAFGGGSIFELTDSSDFSTDKHNLFCFTADNTNCHLTAIGNGMYKFTLDGKAQNNLKLNYIEFLFNQKQEDRFLYASNNAISRPIGDAVLKQDGIPFLAPEIVLLYKSCYIESLEKEDESALHAVSAAMNDFNLLLPKLNNERKEWLKKALRAVYPSGHAWIRRIERLSSL